MDELRRAMLDAGAPPDEWQAELPFLIEAGQKRVRRRRMIATGVAAAVITAVGTTAVLAGVPGLNKSEPEPVKELPSGIYVEERISPADVDRRCTTALNNQTGDKKTWVAGVNNSERAVPAAESVRPVENRVGHVVEVATPGSPFRPGEADGAGGAFTPPESAGSEGLVSYCTIPQESELDSAGGQPDGSPPVPDDSRGIANRCSDYGGYDVRAWDMLVAVGHGQVEAVFMSNNGYVVSCVVSSDFAELRLDERRFADDDGRAVLPADDSGRRDPDRYRDVRLRCSENEGADQGGTVCSAIGVIPGLPDGYRVEVTMPDGVTRTTTTKRGAYGIWIKLSEAEAIGLNLHVRAPDGVVVWKHKTTTPSGGGGGVGSQESYFAPPATPPRKP